MKWISCFVLAMGLSGMISAQKIDHSALDKVLKTYVSDKGEVNYKGMAKDEDLLIQYLDEMSTVQTSQLNKNEALAYWINLYNAATLKLILDNYPLKSILDLNNGKVWDRKIVNTGKGLISLNHIEHEIIRKEFDEPRIHAAVNCASFSCPPLLNEVFSASTLDAQLDRTMKNFINLNTHNSLSADKLRLSSIFDWYGEDFGDLISYIRKYSAVKINSDAKIEFLKYDWSLNE